MSAPLLSVKTASGKSGLTIPEIIRSIREFRLRAKRINGAFYVSEDDLLAFLDKPRTKAA
jgi:hypothetical protein